MNEMWYYIGFYVAGSAVTLWLFRKWIMETVIHQTLVALAGENIIGLEKNSEGALVAVPMGMTEEEREEMAMKILSRVLEADKEEKEDV